MKFNKIYAFIFALTLFFIGNYSVKAENIFPSIVPEFNFSGTSMCFTNRDYDGEQVRACLNSTIAEELGFNYVILETDNVEYPYIALVLSHYSYYIPYASATTYYYGGKYFINENATHHIGYYVNKYGNKVFNFGNHDTNITTSSSYQFLGYYGGTSYNSMINSTTLQTSYNYNTRYHQNYYFGLFLGFKYSSVNSTWEHFGVSNEFTLSTNYFTLDENNHVNILYSSFDIYDYDNETIVHESDYIEIPDIKTNIFINYVEEQGDYQASLNIYDTQPGWYYEITDLETGYITSGTIDSALKSYTVSFIGLTHSKVYYLKIWNNENKDVLYYSNSLQAIIDENKPHIVIKTLVENEDGSHTIDYYFKNTTSKNICSYTTSDIDWISHDCSLYTEDNVNNFTLVNNGLFGVRIREINTNDIVDEYMFNFVNNSANPYITFTGSMSITTRIYTLNYHTYNYLDTDNLYYSKDGINWIYLESFDSSIDFIENNIDVYFKLEDKDGNLKYQTVTKVSYNKDGNYDINSNQDISSMSGKLTQFLKPINYVIDRCVDLYNVLPGKVQDYFFILFLLGIITIVISIIL